VLIGRPALDEEAIRSIEEQHPHIEFDWPAILALREAMPPEEETEPARQPRGRRSVRREPSRAPRPQPERSSPPEPALDAGPEDQSTEMAGAGVAIDDVVPTTRGLLEELVGRDIATRLRGRFAEVMARIHEQGFDETTLAGWVQKAEPLDPDTWLTPDAILEGVRDADARFEALRSSLLAGR
jgi:hypothetical protein